MFVASVRCTLIMVCFRYVFLHLFLISWVCSFTSAGTLPPNWKDFIDPDVFGKTNDDSRYDGDRMEGDINNLVLGEMPTNAGANAIEDKKSLWPNNTIPYEFTNQQSTRFRPAERTMIMEAMNIIMLLTGQCVKFVERNAEEDYIKFQKGPSCFADIGRIGGRQTVSYSPSCVEHYGCIQHELMHVLGFYHEQSRLDRDEHVFTNWDNIAKENKDQFNKRSGITYGLPYDYESIMHYAYNAFAINEHLPTIVPKERAKIGQNENLSPLDVVRIHRRLKCGIPAGKTFVSAQVGQQPKSEQSNVVVVVASDGDKVNGKEFCEKNCPNATAPIILVGSTCNVNETENVYKDDLGNTEPSLVFSDASMTREQCAAQFTPQCRNQIRTIGDCKSFKGLEIYCTGPVTLPELTGIVTAVSKPPLRAVYLGMDDGPLLTYENFAPVRTQIVRFIFDTCLSQRSFSKLAELRLPNLWHLEVKNCYDLEIRKDDYKHSRKIRLLVFHASTIRTLEKGAFSDLPDLQLLSMEFWMNRNEIFAPKLRDFSNELHCGCGFAWFRRWLKRQPRLIQGGQQNKLYYVPDSWFNYEYGIEAMNLRIDCSQPFPSGNAAVDFSQLEFSINEKEDQCR